MIARIRGEIAGRNPDSLIVDVGGVGYLVYAPVAVIARARGGADITLHTNLVVREDSMTLYGFTDVQEQRLFQTLIAVNGVGPKVALALLSILKADELSYAIASGNAAALARAPRGGPNLASRLALAPPVNPPPAPPAPAPGGESEEVVAALMGLGYSQAEAIDAVARSDLPADAAIEEKVRLALAHFTRGHPA